MDEKKRKKKKKASERRGEEWRRRAGLSGDRTDMKSEGLKQKWWHAVINTGLKWWQNTAPPCHRCPTQSAQQQKKTQTYQKSLRVCFAEIFDRITLFITLSITSAQFPWVSLSCPCLASPARFVFISHLSESGTKTFKAFLSEISLQRWHKKVEVVSYPTRLKAFDAWKRKEKLSAPRMERAIIVFKTTEWGKTGSIPPSKLMVL